MSETIFALATAPGRAAVAVLRLSGPDCRSVLERIGAGRVKPRRASLRTLRDARGEPLDRALVLWFPGPGSYTGEDCAELQIHGGPAVVDAVTEALLAVGLRLAEPGEFTRRAFENGRLDLGQAEAVADLIDAETTAQARQALAQLDGALGDRHRAWRGRLLEILALLEAGVDFPDEDLPAGLDAGLRQGLAGLIEELDAAIADAPRGRRVREGYTVAIVGAPNAGKSSLLNGLAEREAAIVTAAPGATRDIIEVPLRLSGYRVLLADTAGLRDAADPVEAEGVRRARAWASGADLRLWVVDRAAQTGDWEFAAALVRPGDLCLENKADLPLSEEGARAVKAARDKGLEVLTLSMRGGGAAEVASVLGRRVVMELAGGDFPAATRARHVGLLNSARQNLGRAMIVLDQPELAAADVRLAVRALAMITGDIGVEDVIGEIFGRFCIGK